MNGTMVAGEYRDDGTISIRLVLQEKPCFALKIGDKYALDSLAENVIMTAGVPETGVVNFIIRFDESGNEYIHNFGTMKWEPLAMEPSDDARELVFLIRQGMCWIDSPIMAGISDRLTDQEASARITARDERIRRECAEKAVSWYNEPDVSHEEKYDDDEYWNNALRAAIMGGKE